MGGLFGVVSRQDCSKTLFYGADYHSHLGTENGGMAVYGDQGFYNTIHSISQAQFKSRFVDDYKEMRGYQGIGAIDDVLSERPLLLPYVEPREHMQLICRRCSYRWPAAPEDGSKEAS